MYRWKKIHVQVEENPRRGKERKHFPPFNAYFKWKDFHQVENGLTQFHLLAIMCLGAQKSMKRESIYGSRRSVKTRAVA